MMPWGVAAAVAGSVVSSALAPSPSDNANAAANASDPFRSQRGQYQTMLSNLINDPSSITSTPGYQFNLQQGLNAVEGTNAASGLVNSGNVLTALTQYGQNYATNQYQNQVSTLAGLAGANVGSPAAAGQILQGQNALNQQSASTLGSVVGQTLGTAGANYFGSSYQSGSDPFAGSSGYGVGGNTYGFSSGVSDSSYGVSYGFGA